MDPNNECKSGCAPKSYEISRCVAKSCVIEKSKIIQIFATLGLNRPRYELIFLEEGKIVAKVTYCNGINVPSKFKIPAAIQDIVEVKLFGLDQTESATKTRGIIYLKNGKMLAKRMVKNGQTISVGEIPEGMIVERYNDGELKNIFFHYNGKRNGYALGFYPSGKMKLEVFYKDDFPEGVLRRYYENGNIMVESKMVNLKKIYYKEFFKDGKLKDEKYYKNTGN